MPAPAAAMTRILAAKLANGCIILAACEELGLENVCWPPSFRAGLIARLLREAASSG